MVLRTKGYKTPSCQNLVSEAYISRSFVGRYNAGRGRPHARVGRSCGSVTVCTYGPPSSLCISNVNILDSPEKYKNIARLHRQRPAISMLRPE